MVQPSRLSLSRSDFANRPGTFVDQVLKSDFVLTHRAFRSGPFQPSLLMKCRVRNLHCSAIILASERRKPAARPAKASLQPRAQRALRRCGSTSVPTSRWRNGVFSRPPRRFRPASRPPRNGLPRRPRSAAAWLPSRAGHDAEVWRLDAEGGEARLCIRSRERRDDVGAGGSWLEELRRAQGPASTAHRPAVRPEGLASAVERNDLFAQGRNVRFSRVDREPVTYRRLTDLPRSCAPRPPASTSRFSPVTAFTCSEPVASATGGSSRRDLHNQGRRRRVIRQDARRSRQRNRACPRRGPHRQRNKCRHR